MPFNEQWSVFPCIPISYVVDLTLQTDAVQTIHILRCLLEGERSAYQQKSLVGALRNLEMMRYVVTYFTLRYTMDGWSWFREMEVFRPEALHALPQPAPAAFGSWLKDLPPEVFPELDPAIHEQLLNRLGITEDEYRQRLDAFLSLKNKVGEGK